MNAIIILKNINMFNSNINKMSLSKLANKAKSEIIFKANLATQQNPASDKDGTLKV